MKVFIYFELKLYIEAQVIRVTLSFCCSRLNTCRLCSYQTRALNLMTHSSLCNKTPARPAVVLLTKFDVVKKNFLIWASLAALIFQNTALVLLMKYSYRASASEYSAASVVAGAEFLKLIMCTVMVCVIDGRDRAVDTLLGTAQEARLAIPSILYLVQNNMLFEAVHNLPTSVYVVCSQGKIITSAFFSVTILGTTISGRQYLALFFLICGMILVQLPSEARGNQEKQTEVVLYGLFAVTLACFTSGFAGVFLEKIYKDNKDQISVWAKNLQLTCISFPLAVLLAVSKDRQAFALGHMLRGFDVIVIAIILLQAAGGLIVALVMRFASTLLKCFAVSISICLCATWSAIHGEGFHFQIICGIGLVNIATALFSVK